MLFLVLGCPVGQTYNPCPRLGLESSVLVTLLKTRYFNVAELKIDTALIIIIIIIIITKGFRVKRSCLH